MSVNVSHVAFATALSLVSVSHVEFDPQATTGEVRVAWVQFDPAVNEQPQTSFRGRYFGNWKRPKYWWEKDPENIPYNIPLVDLLEEVEEEERELASFIGTLEDDGFDDRVLHVLRMYAEILRDQAEAKRTSRQMQAELATNNVKRANRKKAMILLLH